jgi:peptidoglycan/LPS O-acetylase OafA/YrhL
MKEMSEDFLRSIRVDALRGIAAMSVVLFHVRTELWVGWNAMQAHPESYSTIDRALSWLGVPMAFMGVGVLLFFVLSGYCIHSPQATGGGSVVNCQKTEGIDHPNWARFLTRRVLRIYPPYLIALVLSGLVLTIAQEFSEEGKGRLLASFLMLQNYWPPGGQISTNPSLWSLPVELEWYLIYPLAWWLGRRVGWTWVLFLAMVVSLVGQWSSLGGVRWLDASFPRFWVLWCAGAWVAERRWRGTLPRWNVWWSIGLACVVMAAAVSERIERLQAMAFWLWGIGGLLMLLWATAPLRRYAKPVPGVWLSWSARIGVFSYSLYLIHYPLFHWAGRVWQSQIGGKPSSLLVPLAAVICVIPVAWLFYRWIEEPSHRLARRLGRRQGETGSTSGRTEIVSAGI